MLPKQHRFASRPEIRQVFRAGKRSNSTSFTVVQAKLPSRKDLPWRLAVVVSKKVAPLATARNAIRRRIYEAAWLQKAHISSGIDLIFLAQRSVNASSSEQLEHEIKDFLL